MTGNAPRHETQIAYHRRRMGELKTIRSPWEGIWQTCADFIEPTRLRLSRRKEGAIKRDKIVDSTATFALRTLASGMHSGITSPARPWFRLSTGDAELDDYAPVKIWLADVAQILRQKFQGSNIYTAFHLGYSDLGQFGQSAGLLVEDERETIRMMQLLHGRYWIARDENGVATTLYREFDWSVQRIVGRFGYDNVSKISPTIMQAYDTGKYDDIYTVCHAVEPRMERDPEKIDKRNKAFLSNYWLDETTENPHRALLEESGFDENPIIAPPWELSGDDHYALSPGQIAIGDVKMLQTEQIRKLEGIDKKVRPPMTGPTSMRNNPSSLLPGSITYVDDTTGKGYRPAMEVNLQLGELREDIRETQDRIRQTFYADLFLMLSNMDGIQPRNNFEIAERKEEKLLALGPVLENVYNAQLEPTIERTFNICHRRGELPPPPRELEGRKLEVEYISILAQAQKAISTGSIERGVGFAGQLAAVKPEILDKIDGDEVIDVYFDYLGVPPSVLVSDEKVKQIREGRAKQQQAAANAEMMAQVAPAAKAGADAAAVLAGAQENSSGQGLLQQIGIG